jgi:hypothetical protein
MRGAGAAGGLFFMVLLVLMVIFFLRYFFTVGLPQWERERKARAWKDEQARLYMERRNMIAAREAAKEKAKIEQLDDLLDRLLVDPAQYELWAKTYQHPGAKLDVVPDRNLQALLERGWNLHRAHANGVRFVEDVQLPLGFYQYLTPPPVTGSGRRNSQSPRRV